MDTIEQDFDDDIDTRSSAGGHGGVRPDMLYQYLLDEVARKQPKVIKKKLLTQGDRRETIVALEVLDDDNHGQAFNGMGINELQGEPVSKNTGLHSLMRRSQQRQNGGGVVKTFVARSRSEKQLKRRGRSRTRRGHSEEDEEDEDDEDSSVPNTPHLPAFAVTRVAKDDAARREGNRLTM